MTRRASRTALSRALERMVSLHVSTLGRAGGVSARMVVSHLELDVCSELVALAVRVPGRGRRTVRSRAARPPRAGAARPRGAGRILSGIGDSDVAAGTSSRSGNVFRRARPL